MCCRVAMIVTSNIVHARSVDYNVRDYHVISHYITTAICLCTGPARSVNGPFNHVFHVCQSSCTQFARQMALTMFARVTSLSAVSVHTMAIELNEFSKLFSLKCPSCRILYDIVTLRSVVNRKLCCPLL